MVEKIIKQEHMANKNTETDNKQRGQWRPPVARIVLTHNRTPFPLDTSPDVPQTVRVHEVGAVVGLGLGVL